MNPKIKVVEFDRQPKETSENNTPGNVDCADLTNPAFEEYIKQMCQKHQARWELRFSSKCHGCNRCISYEGIMSFKHGLNVTYCLKEKSQTGCFWCYLK